jgi:hypothetical protein
MTRDAHDAVPDIVGRFLRRARKQPTLEIEDALDSATLDSIAEVDAMFAPDVFRPALRCAGSVLRRWLVEEFRVGLRATRGWRASFVEADGFELGRDARQVADGAWLRGETLNLFGTEYRVRLVP